MGLPAKVSLNFGDGVTAVVKLLTAVEKSESGLKMVCNGLKSDGSGVEHAPVPVKSPTYCPTCDMHGNHYTFPRGQEVDGKMVVVSAEELAAAKGEPIKSITVKPHRLEKVLANTFPGESQYLMIPSDAMSVETYCMVHQALLDNPDTALIATFAVQTSNKLWRVGPFEDGLSLSELAWPEDVKARPAIPRVTVIPELRTFATQWIEVMTDDFDPLAYRNLAKAGTAALIAARVGSAPPVQVLPGVVPANVSMSLLDRLKASVEAATAESPPVKKPAAKRPAAKKTAARKSA